MPALICPSGGMVDTAVSKAAALIRRVGSIPTLGTMVKLTEGVNGGPWDGEIILFMNQGDRVDPYWLIENSPKPHVRIMIDGRMVGTFNVAD